ncbi:MAG: hypothetical protein HY909_15770 [Deltaproteobacteria bacterium]|nr:hypothetical protein [Deltaproteobacteria bacterium]
MTHPVLGFDRKLALSWLDAAAELSRTSGNVELRRRLRDRLRAEGLGITACGKTATVLARVWGAPTPSRAALRERATQLWLEAPPGQRVALHWGLAVASYPFLRDVADVIGRLFGVQGTVGLAQVERRIVERWGDRSTVRCAVGRAVNSMRAWGLLANGPRRGIYRRSPPVDVGPAIGLWLLEALLEGTPGGAASLPAVLGSPVLFPFALALTPHEVRRSTRLVVDREGLDAEVVSRRAAPAPVVDGLPGAPPSHPSRRHPRLRDGAVAAR